jgi:processed acidic surface protein
MKKAYILLMVLLVTLCLQPLTARAAEVTSYDTDLTAYLEVLSNERGMEVTKDDLEFVLSLYSESLADFDSVDGLKSFLGETIKADHSNLTSIYEKYSLNQTTLEELLSENGETLNDFIFLSELEDSVYFYSGNYDDEKETGFDEKLTAYLNEVSNIRGFTVTNEMLTANLTKYLTSLDAFDTVANLSDYLGDVIKADLSNLDTIYKDYSFTQESLETYLLASGKSLTDYIFVDDLETDILINGGYTFSYKYVMELFESIFPGITDKLGLTEEEYNRASEYFATLTDYYSSEDTQTKIIDLYDRFMNFATSLPDSKEDITLQDMAKLQSFYNEYEDILKLKFNFSIIKNGKKVPFTLNDMLGDMDLADAILNISIYTPSSEFLLDMNISADMFGDLLEEAESITDKLPLVTGNKADANKPVKTVKGGTLPKTASSQGSFILLGALLITAGGILLNRRKNNKDEKKAA